MAAPTGNALSTLITITNVAVAGDAQKAASDAYKAALEYAVDPAHLLAEGAPIENAKCQAALDAHNAMQSASTAVTEAAALADIKASVAILNEAANQS